MARKPRIRIERVRQGGWWIVRGEGITRQYKDLDVAYQSWLKGYLLANGYDPRAARGLFTA